MRAVGDGIDFCLLAGEIQLSSGSGLRTDFEGVLVMPLITPVELDLSGMALGEVGFSPSICDMGKMKSRVWVIWGDRQVCQDGKSGM